MGESSDVGFWRTFFGLSEATSTEAFESSGEELIGGADIDPAVFGLTSWETSVTAAPRVDRRTAMQVPAVKRCRDLIAGTLGGLPIDLYAPDRSLADSGKATLLAQPERNVPRSITMTRLFEDLLFEGIAWWLIDETRWGGYPAYIKRLAPQRVVVDQDNGLIYLDGKKVANPEDVLIRFDAPTDGLLKAGARAIRTCAHLDVAAAKSADGTPPIQYFTPADGLDPVGPEPDDEDDDYIKGILSAWQTARRTGTTGYVPASLALRDAGWDPKKLQLAEQRQHAVLEIARQAGIDPEELGVSTTSRTYSNMFERRKAFVDFTLGLYMHPVEDRLSMGDITERGYYSKFNLDAFLRSDPLARYQAYAAGKAVGALDDDDIARLEDKPATGGGPTATITPLRIEESA